MICTIYYLLAMLALNVITYQLYLAVMHLQEMRDAGKLKFWPHPFRWMLAYFTLIVGLLADTLLNWLWFSAIGIQWPHEFLSTDRLNDWYNAPADGRLITEWRRSIASGYGDEFLNDADPDGKHIKLKGQL